MESQVAVRPAIFRRGFFAHSIIPAQFRHSTGNLARPGFAVVNVGDTEAQITLQLVDQNGEVIGQVDLTLPADGQEAQFVDELFDQVPDGFQGVLELLTESEGIVSMGLLQTGLVTTSLRTHHYGSWMQSQ